MKHKKITRVLSWVLCVTMLLTDVSLPAHAQEETDNSFTSIEAMSENGMSAADEDAILSEGDASDENISEGDTSDGNVSDENVSEGDVSDGDVSDENVSEGDVSGGNVSDGDVSEGNVSDGNVSDGNVSEGDASDGNISKKNDQAASIDLSEAFPDEALRALVLEGLELRNYDVDFSDGTATLEQLAKIDSISNCAFTFTEEKVKDLTGITYLTGLSYLSLSNHEIADISMLSKLPKLTNIILNGNEVSQTVDLSDLTQLKSLELNENLLKKEDYQTIAKKAHGAIRTSYEDSKQRTEGFTVIAENQYYIVNGKTGIYVEPRGFKSTLPYTIKFLLNGTEVSFEKAQYGGVYFYYTDDLSAGSENALTVQLYAEDTKIAETEKTFTVVSQEVFDQKGATYFSQKNTSLYLYIADMDSSRTAVSAVLKDSEGKVWAQSYNQLYSGTISRDRRMTTVGDELNGLNLQSPDMSQYNVYNVNMNPLYTTMPVGDYDLELTYEDDSTYLMKSAAHVIPDSTGAVTGINLAGEYDSTGENLYLSIYGCHVDPSKLEYTMVDPYTGEVNTLTYVGYKRDYNTWIVKLNKNGAKASGDNSCCLKLSSEEMILCVDQARFYLGQQLYYSMYNPVTGKVELGISGAEDGKTVSLELKKGYGDSAESYQIHGNGVVENGIAYVSLFKADESACTLEDYPKNTTVYYHVTYEGEQFKGSNYFNYSNYASATPGRGTWYNSQNFFNTANEGSYIGFRSEFAYDTEHTKVSNYSYEILLGEESTPLNGSVKCINSDQYVNVILYDADFSNYDPGAITIRLLYKNTAVSSTTVQILDSEYFYLNNIREQGTNSGRKLVYLSTPNIGEYQNLQFTFRDMDGNEISDVMLADQKLNASSGTLYFSGLEEYAQVYAYVEHKDKGAAVKTTDVTQGYFQDTKGILLKFAGYSIQPSTEGQKTVGLYSFGNPDNFPVTVSVYRPYDAEVLAQLSLKQSDFDQSGYYYFKKDFLQLLPVENALYHLVLECADGTFRTDKCVLAVSEKNGQTDENAWSVTVDKTEINLNDTALLTYTGKATPVVTSSDKSILTVQKAGSNQYTITPVSAGNAQIKVTANKETRMIDMTVTSKLSIRSISLNYEEIQCKKGDSVRLEAVLNPVAAIYDGIEYTAESSDTDVLTVNVGGYHSRGVNLYITPKECGEATVTVRVKGVDVQATCKVTVTDTLGVLDEKTEVEKVGMLCALIHSVDKEPTRLKSVALPEGWSWIDGEEILQAYENRSSQNFPAQLIREGYEPLRTDLKVYITEITGIEIVGDERVLQGDSGFYQAGFHAKGYQFLTAGVVADLEYNWIDGKNLVNPYKSNYQTAVYTAGDVKKDTKDTIKLSITRNGKVLYTATKKVTIAAAKTVDEISVRWPSDQPENAVKVSKSDDFSSFTVSEEDLVPKTSDTFVLYADGLIEGMVTDTALVWKSSDPGVATVSVDKTTKKATVTVRKTGITYLTIQAKDATAYSREIRLDVKAFSPVVSETKFTCSKYRTYRMNYWLQNDNGITDVAVYSVDKKGEKTSFDFLCVLLRDGQLCFQVTDSENRIKKNTTYKNLVLGFQCENGKTYDIPVNITIDVKEPTFKIKQTQKANLFYQDAGAAFSFSSDTNILKIEDVTAEETGAPGIKYYGQNGNLLIFKAEGLNADTLSAFKNGKGTETNRKLKVSFGEDDEEIVYEKIIDVKIGCTVVKPSYALTDVTYGEGFETNMAVLYDSKTKNILSSRDTQNCTLELLSPTEGITVTLMESYANVTSTLKKSVKCKLRMERPDWTQPVELTLKLKYVKQLETKLSATTVLLNTAVTIQKNDTSVVEYFIEGVPNAYIRVSLTGKTPAAAALLNSGALYYDDYAGRLEVGLNEGYEVKAGSYAYIAKFQMYGSEAAIKDKIITIKVVDGKKNKPSVKLSAKGSINLLDRENTYIVYTPKISNMTAQITGVALSGTYADRFTSWVDAGGTIGIAADSTAKFYSSKMTYTLDLQLHFDNGYELSVPVKIKPVVKYPNKVTAKVSGPLYKNVNNEITIVPQCGDAAVSISDFVIVEDKAGVWNYFTVMRDSGEMSLSLNEKGMKKCKSGQTYTLTIRVWFEGQADDVAGKDIPVKIVIK